MAKWEMPFFADQARDDAEERAVYVGVDDAEQARRDRLDAEDFADAAGPVEWQPASAGAEDGRAR
jgi:hypothetical protein